MRPMYVHNFYADLLISVRTLFDQHIFRPGLVRRYEFNIANRTFALGRDYETNYELPAVMVNLGQELYPFGQRETVVKLLTSPANTLQTPVLYDEDTGEALILQEEQVIVPIDIVINCESQLRAKELESELKKFLPADRYIQFLSFSSFLEVPLEFLGSVHFDVNSHRIWNLFTKFNYNTGRAEFCFSVSYRPLMRLESLVTTIPDPTQRSFQVTLTLNYFLQMPVYLFSAKEKVVERIVLDYGRFGFEPICEYPLRSLIAFPEKEGFVLRRSYIIYDEAFFQVGGEKVFLVLSLGDRDSIRLTPACRFELVDVQGEIHPVAEEQCFFDESINRVTIGFPRQAYDGRFRPSLTSPVVLRVFLPK
ncbi:MAG: hypothetical protein QW835_00235 [Candidatus Hadarchaeum sp.]